MNSKDNVDEIMRSGGANGSRCKYTLRIPDRYRVLVVGCQWRGGGSEIGSLVSLVVSTVS